MKTIDATKAAAWEQIMDFWSYVNTDSSIAIVILGYALNSDGSKYAEGLDESCVFDADYLFGYGITGIPEGSYTIFVTPVAYIGDTAISFETATYQNVTIAADGTVSITKLRQNPSEHVCLRGIFFLI